MSKRGSTNLFSIDVSPRIEGILIITNNGVKLCGKYYSNHDDFINKTNQEKFEKLILNKANRSISSSDSFVFIYIYHFFF